MITLSAPNYSGYKADFETAEEAQIAAAKILGVDLADMVEVLGPDGDRMYCYASQSDAVNDTDGAYTVQYYGWE